MGGCHGAGLQPSDPPSHHTRPIRFVYTVARAPQIIAGACKAAEADGPGLCLQVLMLLSGEYVSRHLQQLSHLPPSILIGAVSLPSLPLYLISPLMIPTIHPSPPSPDTDRPHSPDLLLPRKPADTRRHLCSLGTRKPLRSTGSRSWCRRPLVCLFPSSPFSPSCASCPSPTPLTELCLLLGLWQTPCICFWI